MIEHARQKKHVASSELLTAIGVPPLPYLTGEKKHVLAKKETPVAPSPLRIWIPLTISTLGGIVAVCRSFSMTGPFLANLMLTIGAALVITSLALVLVYVLILLPAQRKGNAG